MYQIHNILTAHIRKEAPGTLNYAGADLVDLVTFSGLRKLLNEFAGLILKHIVLAAERSISGMTKRLCELAGPQLRLQEALVNEQKQTK